MFDNNFQAYASSAVFTVELSENTPPSRENKPAPPSVKTVNIEIAPCLDGKADHRQKVIFQPTMLELPLLVSLFLGFIPAFKIQRPCKWLSLTRQKERNCIFIKGAETKIIAMPVDAANVFLISDILLARLCENLKSHPDFVLANLKSTAALYLSKSLLLAQATKQ